jgi:hypothetical protein
LIDLADPVNTENTAKMTLSTKALVVALISVIFSPVLIATESIAFFLSAMLMYEPSNVLIIKIVSVIVVVLIAAVALAPPVIAFVMGKRARSFIRSSEITVTGSSKALVAQVIAGIVIAGVLIMQVYLALWAVGVCNLEGC